MERRVNEKIYASHAGRRSTTCRSRRPRRWARWRCSARSTAMWSVLWTRAAGASSSAAAPMCKTTAQIGCFKILSESSVAAGIRRVEATTGFGVLALLDERIAELTRTAAALKANNLKDVPARAEAMAAELKETRQAAGSGRRRSSLPRPGRRPAGRRPPDVDGVRVVTMRLEDGVAPDALRGMMDTTPRRSPRCGRRADRHQRGKDHAGCRRWQGGAGQGPQGGRAGQADRGGGRRQRRRQAGFCDGGHHAMPAKVDAALQGCGCRSSNPSWKRTAEPAIIKSVAFVRGFPCAWRRAASELIGKAVDPMSRLSVLQDRGGGDPVEQAVRG